MRRASLLTLLLCVLFSSACSGAYDPGRRSVTENRIGLYYTWPSSGWDDIGAYIGLRQPNDFRQMTADAIKAVNGRLQHFYLSDETGDQAYFPYTELKALEAREVAAGRDPIFVTATYEGRSRPVMFYLHRNQPGAQAVNVSDPRYLDFFVQRYVHEVLWVDGVQNQWVGLDNCIFDYDLYGVYDDDGNFVTGVQWDEPFPQNNAEWIEALTLAFQGIAERDPSIRFTCNEGISSSEAEHERVVGDLEGVVLEDMPNFREPDRGYAEQLYIYYQRTQTYNAEKVQIYNPRTEGDRDRIRAGYLLYKIFTGPNGFFGPRGVDEVAEPPETYQPIGEDLGAPVGEPSAEQPAGRTSDGWRLYSRPFERGFAYVNWTGQRMTVELPSERTFLDREGRVVRELELDHMSGDYVVYGD